MDFQIYNHNDVINHDINDISDRNIRKVYMIFNDLNKPYAGIENNVNKNKVSIIYFNPRNLPDDMYTTLVVSHYRTFTNKCNTTIRDNIVERNACYHVEIMTVDNKIVTMHQILNYFFAIRVNNNDHQNNVYDAEKVINNH